MEKYSIGIIVKITKQDNYKTPQVVPTFVNAKKNFTDHSLVPITIHQYMISYFYLFYLNIQILMCKICVFK